MDEEPEFITELKKLKEAKESLSAALSDAVASGYISEVPSSFLEYGNAVKVIIQQINPDSAEGLAVKTPKKTRKTKKQS